MKLIKAYVREFMANTVISALKDLKSPRMTVVDAKAGSIYTKTVT